MAESNASDVRYDGVFSRGILLAVPLSIALWMPIIWEVSRLI